MIIEMNDKDIEYVKKKENLIEFIRDNGIAIFDIKKNVWKTEDDKIILKGSQFYKQFELVNKKSSIAPWYTIVDEINERITILHVRTQNVNGSTYQKLPYGKFIVNDYKKEYKDKLKRYDIEVAFIMNSFWEENDARYGNLINYIKNDLNILVWKNKFKI